MRGGAYRILEPLGKGGMGALYLAADTGAFDRKCVVKELLDYYDPTDAEEARKAQARFETEARLLAELSHPGIPRIYSYFSEAGRHYIVMEYIEGETLERAVANSGALGRTVAANLLPAEEVVRHAIRVCQVLEYLADRPTPVIHHDIKPANLIVDQTSGEVRLVDFGTAQIRTPWATRARLQSAKEVKEGQGVSSTFGTEGYAAPEQFQGGSEPRSDVYALAATAYHLLTGDDPADHPFQFPQLETLPDPLADALGRALRPEVQRRSTALELRQALEAWLMPEDGAQPFVFRSGAMARTTADLVTLCDKHWSEARQHLADGDFDRWFRSRNRHDLVAKASSARLERDADAALEAFLRRLNPRLPPPRLVVEPSVLDFRQVTRSGTASQCLTVRNERRGYGQAGFSASVPWLVFEPTQVGCAAGTEAAVTVRLDTAALPLRRDHQAVITCTPTRGARISIPVTAEVSLTREIRQRVAAGLWTLSRWSIRGGRRGMSLWARTFRSLIRSRYGMWVMLCELLVLDGVMIALWWNWRGRSPDPGGLILGFFQALPLALLAVYLLPLLFFIVGAVAWEASRALLRSVKAS